MVVPSNVGKRKIDCELNEFELAMKEQNSNASNMDMIERLQGQRQLLMAKMLENQNRMLEVVKNEQEITIRNMSHGKTQN